MRISVDEKGFTLVEIMIVIAIIGLLSAIAIPVMSSYRERAQDGAVKSALHQLARAQADYYTQYNTYTLDRAALYVSSGWTVESPVMMSIKSAGKQSWSATATHSSSVHIFTYSSSKGGIQ